MLDRAGNLAKRSPGFRLGSAWRHGYRVGVIRHGVVEPGKLSVQGYDWRPDMERS